MKVNIPADKSLTHRAFLFAAMAQGRSYIQNPLLGEDCLSTLRVIKALGCHVTIDNQSNVEIHSPGVAQWQSPKEVLNCGNSGTTARLLIGLLAALPHLEATLDGDESLSRRPMKRITEVFQKFGTSFQYTLGTDGLPLRIRGAALQNITSELFTASAQMKTAILLASLCSQGDHQVRLPAGSRDHTEKMMRVLGISFKQELTITKDFSFETIYLQGPQKVPNFNLLVPSDPSSAAFFIVLGLLKPTINELICEGVLQNPTRTGLFQVLERSGAAIHWQDEPMRSSPEPLGTLKVVSLMQSRRTLQPFLVKQKDVPALIDEIPLLAICGLFAKGTSSIQGVAELRNKESDRLAQTVKLLRAAGGNVEIKNDELVIHGPTARLAPFEFDTENDHRLAMCAAVLEALVGKPCQIMNRNCVDISFPDFYATLERVLKT